MKTKIKHQIVAADSKISKEIKALMFDFKESLKQIDNILFIFRQNKKNNLLDIYSNKKILKCKIINYKLIKDFNNRKGIAFTKPLICSNNEFFNSNSNDFNTNNLKRVINFFIDNSNNKVLRIRGFSILIEDGICSRVKLRSLGPSLDLEIINVIDSKE